jgi:hypothetical protein
MLESRLALTRWAVRLVVSDHVVLLLETLVSPVPAIPAVIFKAPGLPEKASTAILGTVYVTVAVVVAIPNNAEGYPNSTIQQRQSKRKISKNIQYTYSQRTI